MVQRNLERKNRQKKEIWKSMIDARKKKKSHTDTKNKRK